MHAFRSKVCWHRQPFFLVRAGERDVAGRSRRPQRGPAGRPQGSANPPTGSDLRLSSRQLTPIRCVFTQPTSWLGGPLPTSWLVCWHYVPTLVPFTQVNGAGVCWTCDYAGSEGGADADAEGAVGRRVGSGSGRGRGRRGGPVWSAGRRTDPGAPRVGGASVGRSVGGAVGVRPRGRRGGAEGAVNPV